MPLNRIHIGTGEDRGRKTQSGGTECKTLCGAWLRRSAVIARKGQALRDFDSTGATCPKCINKLNKLKTISKLKG